MAAVAAGRVRPDELEEVARTQERYLDMGARSSFLVGELAKHRESLPQPDCDHDDSHDEQCIARRIAWQAEKMEMADRTLRMAAALVQHRSSIEWPACVTELEPVSIPAVPEVTWRPRAV